MELPDLTAGTFFNQISKALIQNYYLGRPRCLYPTTSCACSACSASLVHPAGTTSFLLSTVTTAPLRRSRPSPARSRRFHKSPKYERRLRGSPQAPDQAGSCQIISLEGPRSESYTPRQAPLLLRCPARARWSLSLSGRILTSLSLSF